MTAALVLSVGVSLALIVLILYGILSRSMTKEFYHRLQAQQAESGMILQDRLNFLETKLQEISLNSDVRDGLMLGNHVQLMEIMENYYPPSDGSLFMVSGKDVLSLIPGLPEQYRSLEPYLKKFDIEDRPQRFRFKDFGNGDFLTFFTIPIKTNEDRLGAACLLYDISRDARLWGRMKSRPITRLLVQGNGYLFDLQKGERLKGLHDKEPEPGGMDLPPEESLIPLKGFPGLFFASSSAPLRAEKKNLIIIMVVLCAAVFLLTILTSLFISHRVSEPLECMANQAIDIAKEPSNQFLQEDKIGYIEFKKLARAFNQVLSSLLKAQEELKIRAKNELDASEERYRRTIEAAPDCITISRISDGRFLLINEAFEKICGYSVEETLGKTSHELGIFVNREDRNRIVVTLEEKGEINKHEIRFRRKCGAVFDSLFSARRIRFEGEDCLLAVVTDYTELKEAEEEKKRLEAQLQRALKMEAIGTLAGGVAHDLNNILSGLVSYPELLLMEIPDESPLRKPMITIKESGEKAAAIVQDLLTLARRGVAVTEVLNINSIILEYLNSLEHERLKSYHPGVQVNSDLEKDLLNILGSPVHLFKTVMNLVSNAAEAMPKGGIIRISTTNTYVDTPVKGYDHIKEGDYVVLTISDEGKGIPPEERERIFEPFYTNKVMGKSGTGLGMAVVWGTVRDHNGYIDMKSVEGKGTTFQLYFPITRKESELVGEKPKISLDSYQGRGESILVVDDVKEQRRISSGMLKKLNYSVASVSSGEEALEYLKKNRADLLMLDMVMDQGMDGLETYRKVLELYPGQKAIIVSGFSETYRVKEAQRLGAGAYVRKPYLIEKIGSAIRHELDRRLV